MKLLVITNDFPPRVGGVNYYVSNLLGRFPSGEVTVFASDWPGAEAFDRTFPQKVIRGPAGNMYPTPAIRDLVVELVHEERPDVLLFAAALPLAILGRHVWRKHGVPYAAFTHGVEIWAAKVPAATRILRMIGEDAVLLTCVSRYQGDLFRRAIGPRTKIELLPPGIDADRFHPDVATEPVFERHELGEGPVIGCVSRLTLRKGQDQVIRALPRIAEEFPGVRFLVVGGGPDYDRLRGLARRKRVEDRVVFAGEVPYDELPMYFRAGDVFAMPNRTRKWGLEVEAFGAVFLQAAAVGRPSVAGDSGGAPEAVFDGETGLIVDGNETDEVAEAILELLSDRDRAEKMGRAGAERVRQDFTWDALSTRLRDLLTDALGSVRSSA